MRQTTASLLTCLALAACTDRLVTAPSRSLPAVSEIITTFGEGELLGDVLNNGSGITDSNWTVELTPRTPPTADRLGPYWSGEMWVSPTRHNNRSFMFEWIDPRADGGCGSLSSYLANDISARGSEVHWSTRNSPPTGKELHCIRPGQYTLTLYHQNHAERIIDLDYVPARGSAGSPFSIVNSTIGETELIEELNYDTTEYMWSDLVVNFDIGSPTAVDTPRLLIQNVHANLYADTFVDESNPSGNTHDYFRFSTRGSSTTTSGLGKLLSQIFWDSRSPTKRTGYWDSHSNTGLIRPHQFFDEVSETRVDSVGLDTRRPSEPAVTIPAYWRTISIALESPPVQTLRVFISGPDILDPSETITGTWTQYADYGIDPYSYGSWYYFRYPAAEITVGSGDTYEREVSATSTPYVFRLRATAEDESSQRVTGKFFVEVVPPGGGDGLLGRGTQTQVRLADGTCGNRPASGPARQAWLQWVFEARAGLVELCR